MLTTTASAARRRVRTLSRSRRPVAEGPPPWLSEVSRRLGLPTDPRVALHVVVSGAMAWTMVLVVAGPVVAALAGGGAAAGWVGWRRGASRRQAAADERELPHLLERVARHLRAGGSLHQAFAAAVPPAPPEAPPDGLAHTWSAVAERSAAVGMVPALDEWAERARRGEAASIGLAVAALAVAASTGGSPARAVDGVASTLRSRLAVAEEVRALSSQARASATVIALAPIGFGALAAATDDRTAAFLATPAGVVLAVTGLVLDAVGAWWMARLCRVPA